MIRLLVLVIALAGCDSVTHTEKTSEPFERVEKRSSTHADYCFTCAPGFDGKSKCQFKFSAFCPCSYSAKVLVQPVIRTYESGKREAGEETIEIQRLTTCQ